MTLDILIPHYKEPEFIVKRLLDSINNQQGINFTYVKVIIINDGNEVILSKDFLDQYNFKINYIINKHGGVSVARNRALELSDADFVMFCDSDDMFSDSTGLWQIFANLSKDVDVFRPTFLAEIPINNKILVEQFPQLQETQLIKNPVFTDFFISVQPGQDGLFGLADTYLHGKVFRRQFLVENDIKFPESLTFNEDNYFCKIALMMSKKFLTYAQPYYLWKYNQNSVTKAFSNPADVDIRTFDQCVKSTDLMVQKLVSGGPRFLQAVPKLIYINVLAPVGQFIVYKAFNDPGNSEYRKNGIACLKAFWQKWKAYCEALTFEDYNVLYRQVITELPLLNRLTLQQLQDWIKENLE